MTDKIEVKVRMDSEDVAKYLKAFFDELAAKVPISAGDTIAALEIYKATLIKTMFELGEENEEMRSDNWPKKSCQSFWGI